MQLTHMRTLSARFHFLRGFHIGAGESETHNGEDDPLPAVLAGLRLIELDCLGGSGARAYGKVKFADLKPDGQRLELPKDPLVTGERP